MEKTFNVEGMSCGHCVMAIKKALNKAGILDHRVEIGKVVINTEIHKTNTESIVQAIEEAGYKVINRD